VNYTPLTDYIEDRVLFVMQYKYLVFTLFIMHKRLFDL